MSAVAPDVDGNEDRFIHYPDGHSLCYRVQGPAQGETILLIAGLGLQLVYWPEVFIKALTSAGYQVITADNRDVGRSSRVRTKPPSKLRQLLAWAPADNYSLDDMADDMARLLQHLNLRAVHLVGMSMGGMIGQTLASRHPERVLSLTSIFSTTGNPAVGQPAPSTLWRIARGSAPQSSAEAVKRYTAMLSHIGDPQSPGTEAEWSRYVLQAWERSGQRSDASSVVRQIGAIQKSGDRTAQLRRIQAPTLVVHGDVDLMVDPSGGHATAAAIPNAKLVIVAGMRHQIDAVQTPELTKHILDLIKKEQP
jgi:pimeloyl-ACP methyl ester carboxylesterase